MSWVNLWSFILTLLPAHWPWNQFYLYFAKYSCFTLLQKAKLERKHQMKKRTKACLPSFAFYFLNLQISCLQSSLSKTCTPQTIILKEFAARTFTTKVIKWITKLEPANFFAGNHEKKTLQLWAGLLCALTVKNDFPKIGSVLQCGFWNVKSSAKLLNKHMVNV